MSNADVEKFIDRVIGFLMIVPGLIFDYLPAIFIIFGLIMVHIAIFGFMIFWLIKIVMWLFGVFG